MIYIFTKLTYIQELSRRAKVTAEWNLAPNYQPRRAFFTSLLIGWHKPELVALRSLWYCCPYGQPAKSSPFTTLCWHHWAARPYTICTCDVMWRYTLRTQYMTRVTLPPAESHRPMSQLWAVAFCQCWMSRRTRIILGKYQLRVYSVDRSIKRSLTVRLLLSVLVLAIARPLHDVMIDGLLIVMCGAVFIS